MGASRSRSMAAVNRPNGLAGLSRRSVENMRAAFNPLITWRPGWRDAAELLLLASTLPLYYLVRGVAHTHVDTAIGRGIDIVNFERNLGIFYEVDLQRLVIPYDWLVQLLNNFYLFGHLPVIGALAVWMYFWHRPQYLLMRNAFLLSGAIALIFYVNFPTAPPRLLPHELGFGFVDTVVSEYKESRPLTPSWFVNEYAAFPSMHIGWNLLVGITLWLSTRNFFVRAFAVVMPLAMATDIVLTANHYIIDALAGLAVMLLGLAIAMMGRWLVTRAYSPDSEAFRKKRWVAWLYWLSGTAEPQHQQNFPMGQAAG